MVMEYVKAIIFFRNCTFGHIVRHGNTSPMIRYVYGQKKYCDTISMNSFTSTIKETSNCCFFVCLFFAPSKCFSLCLKTWPIFNRQ